MLSQVLPGTLDRLTALLQAQGVLRGDDVLEGPLVLSRLIQPGGIGVHQLGGGVDNVAAADFIRGGGSLVEPGLALACDAGDAAPLFAVRELEARVGARGVGDDLVRVQAGQFDRFADQRCRCAAGEVSGEIVAFGAVAFVQPAGLRGHQLADVGDAQLLQRIAFLWARG